MGKGTDIGKGSDEHDKETSVFIKRGKLTDGVRNLLYGVGSLILFLKTEFCLVV
jgi:hypothetical protein